MDRWETKHIPLHGGLLLNVPRIDQGIEHPGSLITGINFEPAVEGGYRRVTGFTKFSTTAVTGSDEVLGAFVFNGGVLAMRGTAVLFSSGTTWADSGMAARTGATKYRATKYNWVADTIVCVDSVNDPFKWDGTTYTVLTGAPAGAEWVTEHASHLWFATDNLLTFSAPNSDILYSPIDGGGVINVGSPITGIGAWREELYVFSEDRIQKVTGTSKSNFALKNVTERLGCVNGDSIQEIGGDLLFLGPDGVRTVAGTAAIGDTELASLSEPIKTLVNNMGPTYQAGSISSVVVRQKAQYRLFGAKSTDVAETAFGILGGIRSIVGELSWEWFQTQGIYVACSDSGYINATEFVIHGGWDGFVYRQEIGNSFSGSNVFASFSIPYITYNDPAIRKVLQKLEIFIDAEGLNDIRVTPVFDYASSDVVQPPSIMIVGATTGFAVYDEAETKYDDDDMYDSTPVTQNNVNLEGSCLNCAFIVGSDDQLAPYVIKEIVVQYGLGGRR